MHLLHMAAPNERTNERTNERSERTTATTTRGTPTTSAYQQIRENRILNAGASANALIERDDRQVILARAEHTAPQGTSKCNWCFHVVVVCHLHAKLSESKPLTHTTCCCCCCSCYCCWCLTNGNEAASLRAQAAIVWVQARGREIGAIAQIAILRRWHFISNRVNKQLPSGWFPNFLLQLQPIHIRSAVPTHVATTCFPLSGDICCLSAVGLQSHSCCRWKCLWAPH